VDQQSADSRSEGEGADEPTEIMEGDEARAGFRDFECACWECSYGSTTAAAFAVPRAFFTVALALPEPAAESIGDAGDGDHGFSSGVNGLAEDRLDSGGGA